MGAVRVRGSRGHPQGEGRLQGRLRGEGKGRGGAREGGAGARPERGAAPGVGLEPGRGVPSGPRPLDAHPAALRPRAGDGLLRHDGAGREPRPGRDARAAPSSGCSGGSRRGGTGRVASYEAEFYVWDADGPLDRTPYAGSYALTPAAEFVAELAGTLEEMGIRPEQCHAEVGQGNLELSVGEDEALAAADKRVMVLEAIRGVAYGMGLETTMAPKPYLDGAGNGHHLHVSLYEGDAPVLFDASGALSGAGSGFVAGLLEHLPAVMAFTAPSPTPTSVSPLACGPRLTPPTAWTTGRRPCGSPRPWPAGSPRPRTSRSNPSTLPRTPTWPSPRSWPPGWTE